MRGYCRHAAARRAGAAAEQLIEMVADGLAGVRVVVPDRRAQPPGRANVGFGMLRSSPRRAREAARSHWRPLARLLPQQPPITTTLRAHHLPLSTSSAAPARRPGPAGRRRGVPDQPADRRGHLLRRAVRLAGRDRSVRPGRPAAGGVPRGAAPRARPPPGHHLGARPAVRSPELFDAALRPRPATRRGWTCWSRSGWAAGTASGARLMLRPRRGGPAPLSGSLAGGGRPCSVRRAAQVRLCLRRTIVAGSKRDHDLSYVRTYASASTAHVDQPARMLHRGRSRRPRAAPAPRDPPPAALRRIPHSAGGLRRPRQNGDSVRLRRDLPPLRAAGAPPADRPGAATARSTTSSTRPSCGPGASCSSSAGRAPTRWPGLVDRPQPRRRLLVARRATAASSRRGPGHLRAPQQLVEGAEDVVIDLVEAERLRDACATFAPAQRAVPRAAVPGRALGPRDRRGHGPPRRAPSARCSCARCFARRSPGCCRGRPLPDRCLTAPESCRTIRPRAGRRLRRSRRRPAAPPGGSRAG